MAENGLDDDTKVFNDPIHGHIEFHSLCVAIIDTPQFQRLRNIKQLGSVYLVFPGAPHNRFEHSLGVGYLAGVFLRKLRKRQPELNITDKDVLCVVIAGLCHDLGHGPFSHFDNRFIRQVLKGIKEKSNAKIDGNSAGWKLENASAEMFDYMMEANNLKSRFKAYKFHDDSHSFDENDFEFIKEMIRGPLDNNDDVWKYKGRDESKSFLYEIVTNKHSGIDVDKFDSFARDCYHLGMRSIFDHRRFMQFVRVIKYEKEGHRHICCRDKELGDVYDLFYVRNMLHRRAYQHKNCVIIDYMLTEALLEANDNLKYPGKDGKLLKLSDTIHDMHAYTLVHDGVYHRIRQSEDKALEPARKILEAIENRKLYKCVGQYREPIERPSNQDESEICKEIVELSKANRELPVSEVGVQGDEAERTTVEQPQNAPELLESDVIAQFCTYDYGKGKENPINYVRFYSKRNKDVALRYNKERLSEMSPQIFCEVYVRVYSRDSKKDERVKECFGLFCKKRNFTPHEGGDTQSMHFKPVQAQDDLIPDAD